jgi:hypothetical protein
MSKGNSQPTEKYGSIFSLFVRFFWMLLGNAILLISTIFILQGENWAFHTADVIFWVTIAVLILARYLDIKFYAGLTAMGEPASMVNWQKYAILLLICSTVIWILAHIINYIVVNK